MTGPLQTSCLLADVKTVCGVREGMQPTRPQCSPILEPLLNTWVPWPGGLICSEFMAIFVSNSLFGGGSFPPSYIDWWLRGDWSRYGDWNVRKCKNHGFSGWSIGVWACMCLMKSAENGKECNISVYGTNMGSRDSSVVRALDSWSKGRRFGSGQEWQEHFRLQVSFLCRLLFHYPPWCCSSMKEPGHSAKSAGGRLQLNTHAAAPYIRDFDMVCGCMVYT